MPKPVKSATQNAHQQVLGREKCNHSRGGISTVISFKCTTDRYFDKLPDGLVEHLLKRTILAALGAFQEDTEWQATAKLREQDYDAFYGTMLVAGKPRAVLRNPAEREGKVLNGATYIPKCQTILDEKEKSVHVDLHEWESLPRRASTNKP